MKMKVIEKEDSDEKSSGASDDGDSEYFPAVEEDEDGAVGNEQPSSPKEEERNKKGTEVAAQESKVAEHHKEQLQQMTEEKEQALRSSKKRKGKEAKEMTQEQAAVLQLEEAMVKEASFTEDTPSIMQTTLPAVSQKEADATNISLLSNTTVAGGESDIIFLFASGGGDNIDDVSSNVTTSQEVTLCNTVPSDIIEEEDMTCYGGVNDQSGEGNEDLVIFHNPSAVTHTKRDKEEQREVETTDEDCAVTYEHMNREETKQMLHVKTPNTAGAEEKSQHHEKVEEEQVRNEEEKEDGEMRKRKREDEAASEPVVENAMAPDDILKMAVNSNKKHKTEDGDDDNVKNGDMGQILPT
ncbi:hypothetical protein MTO96_044598 [Rhipicephalus appendiculatus]